MRRHLFLFFTCLVLTSVALPSAAQTFLPKTIQFKGDPEYSDQELMAAAGLKKGVVLTSAEVSDHSKLLMDSGAFSNLTYKFDGGDLTYLLTPAEVMYPIYLRNIPLTTGPELDAKLHERLPLYHGKVPTEGTLLDGVRAALVEMLAAQGINASISAVPSSKPGQHKSAAMSFSIDTPPVLVGDIHLDPASPALDPKAQEILEKQTSSPYDLEGTPNQISTYLGNFYHDNGYLEASFHAVPRGAPEVASDAIRIPFVLSATPGPLYKLSNVQLAPGVLVTQAEFDHQSHIHPGDIADGQHVTQNWQFISRQYHNKGYMKATVHPTPTFDRANSKVAFLVEVDPGPAYTMGKLRIDNVSDDLRTAMLAAWTMPAGTVFNEGAIIGFFATHNVHPALERVFATVNPKYVTTLNDDTHTVDVVLRLDKRN
jgi:outer membrane protein assembly factor BamA